MPQQATASVTLSPRQARASEQRVGRIPAGSRGRWIVERLVFLLAAALILRTWYVQGLFVPVQVVSGSMAPALRGVHRQVTCGGCGHRFCCGSDLRAVPLRAVCPNCGWPGNDLGNTPDLDGDRVLILKSTYGFRPPRRWDVIAFRHPGRAGEICVKRVVGLPGESVQIRGGEVYVDGALQRKTLRQQRALAVPVHDAGWPIRAGAELPPRWRPERDESGWSFIDGRLFHPAVSTAGGADWLTYCHWSRVPARPREFRETPIINDGGYNQARPHRAENVHPVTDVSLSFRLARIFGDGCLLIGATDGGNEFEVRIEPAQSRCDVYRNGRKLETPGPRELPGRYDDLLVEVSLFDQQFLLALGGHPVVVSPYGRVSPPPKASCRPLAIASQGLGMEIRSLRVYRDVYYTRPVGFRGRWGLDEPVRLGPEEYFVLGDNSLISEDSRSWPDGPAVAARLLVGRPFLVHFPARRVHLGVWDFQVPDPGRIRYIR